VSPSLTHSPVRTYNDVVYECNIRRKGVPSSSIIPLCLCMKVVLSEYTYVPILYLLCLNSMSVMMLGTLAERIRAGGAGIPAFYTPTGLFSFTYRYTQSRTYIHPLILIRVSVCTCVCICICQLCV